MNNEIFGTYSTDMARHDSERSLKSRSLRGFKEIERSYEASRAQIPTQLSQIALSLIVSSQVFDLIATVKFV